MNGDKLKIKPGNKPEYRIGIDLGGTKAEVILLAKEGQECFRKRVATPVNTKNNYKSVLETIHTLVNQALSVVPPTDDYTIGVGIPGTMDKNTGMVQHANTTWLAGHYFKSDLEKKLEKEILMDNDANCFTLAEAVGGAATGYKIVFGIIMGTGCGGGLCIDGTIHSGNHGIAGEWGHFSIDPKGEKCFCGNVGCIDTVLSGPGMARSYKKKTGKDLPAEQIVNKARNNDQECMQIFDRFLDDFGKSVGGLISILDPDAIVIGGGLSNIPELYTTGIRKVKKYAYHQNVRTPVLKNFLGDSAGVFGAAWLGCDTGQALK
ncbi:MAG: ROK family protein [Deltaproteobacteria bacterium]|nr:ROK family protein [Deltaproteobacteria bacterium]